MPDTFEPNLLEIKLFKIGCWVSVSATFLLFIIDGFIYEHTVASYVEFAALVSFAGFTYVAYNRPSERNRHFFLFMLLLVANGAFFVEEGWATTSAVVFLISILYGTLLVDSRFASTIVIVFIANFLLLTVGEFFIFSEVKYSSIPFERTQEIHNIYAIIAVVVTALLVNFFKSRYDQERFAINTINTQLAEANYMLSSKNNSLLAAQKEIKLKNELLENNRDKLVEANKELGQLNTYLDETVRKRKLGLAKINQELGLLFYRSSHDFRRPLTTLKGLALVSKLSHENELPNRILDLVDQTADTMNRMLDKFLMLYQISDLPRYPNTNLHEIRTSISELVAKIDNIDFSCEINTNRYESNDRRNFLLNIIIKNLVENCCLYRDEEVNTIVKVNVFEKKGSVHLSVWDDGQGIKEDVRDKIFNIYFRGNELSRGNGLGLYVVQSAVKKLAGSIQVSSKEGEFTKFEISFKL